MFGQLLSMAGTVVGGIASRNAMNKAYKQQLEGLEKRRGQAQARLDNVTYQDSTQLADAQAAITKALEMMRNRKRNAAAAAAVTGATQESQAIENEANAQAMSDLMTNIAVNGDKQKYNRMRDYETEVNSLDDQITKAKVGKNVDKANQIVGATQALNNLVGGII